MKENSMKEVYFECNMGAAGDMLCGALLDAIGKDERDNIVKKLNSVGFKNAEISAYDETRRGLKGTKFNVKTDLNDIHKHTSISEIFDIIDELNVDYKVKENAKNIYKIIADAESEAHGVPVADVHLHEVGMIDAIVDIMSFCFIKKEQAYIVQVEGNAYPFVSLQSFPECPHFFRITDSMHDKHTFQGGPAYTNPKDFLQQTRILIIVQI